ncbi:MAG: S1C family serine protease [Actinomycetota bacterium]|nr:S1C family serine protease [Actinomycetota bacterium]
MLDELQRSAEKVRVAVAPAVVSIGRDGRGCGVVVAEGLVVTNAHNLRDQTTSVTFADGRTEQGTVRGADADTDLAVLTVDTGAAVPPEWSTAQPMPDRAVFAVSRGGSGVARVTFGTISAVDRAFRGPRGRRIRGSVEHTAPLPRGSSGSALVDAEGNLVGISTHRLGEGFYLALATDADLRSRIDALGRGEEPRRPRLGVGLAPSGAAAQLRRAVGLPEREGLLVRVVEEGSPADRAGIKEGDLLVSAGGRPVRTHDDLYDALDAAATEAALAVQLVRGAEEIEVSVSFDEPNPAS